MSLDSRTLQLLIRATNDEAKNALREVLKESEAMHKGVQGHMGGMEKAAGGLGQSLKGVQGHMGGMEKAAGGLGQSLKRMFETTVGVWLGQAIPNAFNQLKNNLLENYDLVADYERQVLSLQTMVAQQKVEASAVTKIVGYETVRVGGAIAVAEGKLADLRMQAKEDDLGYRQAVAALAKAEQSKTVKRGSGKNRWEETVGPDPLKVEAAQLAVEKHAIALEKDSAAFNKLTGSAATYKTVAKTVTEYTLDMATAIQVSRQETEQLIQWAVQLGIKSPFESKGIVESLKSLMTMGFKTDEAKRLTKDLVDFAAATGKSDDAMTRMAYSMGQAKTMGRLMGAEIRELQLAGLPVTQILTKAFNTTGEGIQKMLRDGTMEADKALKAIMESIEKWYAGSAERLANSLAGIGSSAKDVITETKKNLYAPIFEILQPYGAALVNIISSNEVREATKTFGTWLGEAIAGQIDTLKLKLLDLLGSTEEGLTGMGVDPRVTGMIGIFHRLITGTTDWSTAVKEAIGYWNSLLGVETHEGYVPTVRPGGGGPLQEAAKYGGYSPGGAAYPLPQAETMFGGYGLVGGTGIWAEVTKAAEGIRSSLTEATPAKAYRAMAGLGGPIPGDRLGGYYAPPAPTLSIPEMMKTGGYGLPQTGKVWSMATKEAEKNWISLLEIETREGYKAAERRIEGSGAAPGGILGGYYAPPAPAPFRGGSGGPYQEVGAGGFVVPPPFVYSPLQEEARFGGYRVPTTSSPYAPLRGSMMGGYGRPTFLSPYGPAADTAGYGSYGGAQAGLLPSYLGGQGPETTVNINQATMPLTIDNDLMRQFGGYGGAGGPEKPKTVEEARGNLGDTIRMIDTFFKGYGQLDAGELSKGIQTLFSIPPEKSAETTTTIANIGNSLQNIVKEWNRGMEQGGILVAIRKGIGALKEEGPKLWEEIKPVLQGLWKTVWDGIIIEKGWNPFKDFISQGFQDGMATLNNLWNVGNVTGQTNGGIPGAVKKQLGIEDPTPLKVQMEAFGKQLVEWLTGAIKAGWDFTAWILEQIEVLSKNEELKAFAETLGNYVGGAIIAGAKSALPAGWLKSLILGEQEEGREIPWLGPGAGQPPPWLKPSAGSGEDTGGGPPPWLKPAWSGPEESAEAAAVVAEAGNVARATSKDILKASEETAKATVVASENSGALMMGNFEKSGTSMMNSYMVAGKEMFNGFVEAIKALLASGGVSGAGASGGNAGAGKSGINPWEYANHATGFDQVIAGRTFLGAAGWAGEEGPERIIIQPLNPGVGAPPANEKQGVTINVHVHGGGPDVESRARRGTMAALTSWGVA